MRVRCHCVDLQLGTVPELSLLIAVVVSYLLAPVTTAVGIVVPVESPYIIPPPVGSHYANGIRRASSPYKCG